MLSLDATWTSSLSARELGRAEDASIFVVLFRRTGKLDERQLHPSSPASPVVSSPLFADRLSLFTILEGVEGSRLPPIMAADLGDSGGAGEQADIYTLRRFYVSRDDGCKALRTSCERDGATMAAASPMALPCPRTSSTLICWEGNQSGRRLLRG